MLCNTAKINQSEDGRNPLRFSLMLLLLLLPEELVSEVRDRAPYATELTLPYRAFRNIGAGRDVSYGTFSIVPGAVTLSREKPSYFQVEVKRMRSMMPGHR